MKHVILTILVCLDVAAFAALYQRTSQTVVQTILEDLSHISASSDYSIPGDLIKDFRWMQPCIS